jgi:hypothetical protein
MAAVAGAAAVDVGAPAVGAVAPLGPRQEMPEMAELPHCRERMPGTLEAVATTADVEIIIEAADKAEVKPQAVLLLQPLRLTMPLPLPMTAEMTTPVQSLARRVEEAAV